MGSGDRTIQVYCCAESIVLIVLRCVVDRIILNMVCKSIVEEVS